MLRKSPGRCRQPPEITDRACEALVPALFYVARLSDIRTADRPATENSSVPFEGMATPERDDNIRVVPVTDESAAPAPEWDAPERSTGSRRLGIAVLSLAAAAGAIAIILGLNAASPDEAAQMDVTEDTFTPRINPIAVPTSYRHILTLERGSVGWRAVWDPTRIDGTLGAIGGIPAYTPSVTDSDLDPSNTLRATSQCRESGCAITVTPADSPGDRIVVAPGEDPVWNDTTSRLLAWTLETPTGRSLATADLRDLSVIAWRMQFPIEADARLVHWDGLGYVTNSTDAGTILAFDGSQATSWSGVGRVVDATPTAITVTRADGSWTIVDRANGSTLLSSRRDGTIEVARASVTEIPTGLPTETRLQIDLVADSDQPTYEPTVIPTDDVASIRIHRSSDGALVTLTMELSS